MTYAELKAKHQQEVNEFPFMWAFGQNQFDEMLQKNNVTTADIFSIGAGGYIRKSDAKKMEKMFRRQKYELKEARKQNKFLQEAMRSEMANHEYCITCDREEVLAACGITEDDYQSNEDIRKAWKAAQKEYLASYETNNQKE